MQKDGDVWEIFFAFLNSKGTKAFSVSKVKGHATQEHIRKGVSSEVDKDGNDKADEVAEEGVLIHA